MPRVKEDLDKKTDLRVIRTKRSIRQAFLQLIQQKPVSKITVTEIARQASINKGTFYLHYEDIYDLYISILEEWIEESFSQIEDFNLFFDDPQKFAADFYSIFKASELHDKFPSAFDEREASMQIPSLFTDGMSKRIYDTGRIEKNVMNDIRLESAITSLFILGARYHDSNKEEVETVMTQLLKGLFPANQQE